MDCQSASAGEENAVIGTDAAPTTQDECRVACDAFPTCGAFDFNPNSNDPSGRCRFYLATNVPRIGTQNADRTYCVMLATMVSQDLEADLLNYMGLTKLCSPDTNALYMDNHMHAPAYPLLYSHVSGGSCVSAYDPANSNYHNIWDPVQLPDEWPPSAGGYVYMYSDVLSNDYESVPYTANGVTTYYLRIRGCLAHYLTSATDVATALGAHLAAGPVAPLFNAQGYACLLYTSPSPRDATLSRMPSSA